jgi:formylglycine-generating enzyme required for sulfatase activity
MFQCPICRTEYPKQKAVCAVCGWDLQPYSFVTGLIPEVSEKEKSRLDWAKQVWTLLQQRQHQLAQLHSKADSSVLPSPPISSKIEPAVPSQTADVEVDPVRTKQIGDANRTAQIEYPAPLSLSTRLPEPIQPKPASALPLTLEQLDAVEQDASEPPVTQELPDEPAAHSAQSSIQPSLETDSVLGRSPTLSDHPWLGLSELSPQGFTFSVLTVNAQGQTLSCEHREAVCFSEVLEQAVRLELVSIPEGCFRMGSPTDEFERDTHEQLQDNVCLAPFWIGKFPITQAQWRAVAGLPRVNRPLNPEPSSFEGGTRPVEQVTWNDAIEFCDRLARQTNRPYRLPSEVEWEYACRAGSQTPFHFGETLSSELANYDGKYTYRLELPGEYREGTTPVGLFPGANAFGLYDMHGNVWEWCADAWLDSRAVAPIPKLGQRPDQTDYERLLRGGAWYCLPGLCRAAQRHWNQPNYGGSGIGFRVACSQLS